VSSNLAPKIALGLDELGTVRDQLSPPVDAATTCTWRRLARQGERE
jgi:hypothetical protein